MKTSMVSLALVAGLLLAGTSMAWAQDYPPQQPSGVEISCTFDGDVVDCDASGFEPNSDVTGTVSANGQTRRTDQLVANDVGAVAYNFTPACDADTLTVEVSGTDVTGAEASDSTTVDISSCTTPLPQTGAGLALLGLGAIGAAVGVRRRITA